MDTKGESRAAFFISLGSLGVSIFALIASGFFDWSDYSARQEAIGFTLDPSEAVSRSRDLQPEVYISNLSTQPLTVTDLQCTGTQVISGRRGTFECSINTQLPIALQSGETVSVLVSLDGYSIRDASTVELLPEAVADSFVPRTEFLITAHTASDQSFESRRFTFGVRGDH